MRSASGKLQKPGADWKYELRVLFVGNSSPGHIGSFLQTAGNRVGIESVFLDVREAFRGPRILRAAAWRLFGHRPLRLGRFNVSLSNTVHEFMPQVLIVTGIAPVTASTLRSLRQMGIRCVNYLTDDPWNPKNGARHFWEALREFDIIFSPRRSNMDDLRQHGCRSVVYLPFAYAPEEHFPAEVLTEDDRTRFSCDVCFVGGADRDRAGFMRLIAKAGFSLGLYGGYWDRFPDLRPHWRGFVHGSDYRKAVAASKVSLCMGRRANRDGHAMRSLELPAMGACLLVENTEEHRELFGAEGVAVLYYGSPEEMINKIDKIICDENLRRRLARNARQVITAGSHTYEDRLIAMLAPAGQSRFT